MKAFIIRKYGGIDELKEEKVDLPKLEKPTDILVENVSISINPVDAKKRVNFGEIDEKLSAPLILGYDSAGIVKKINNKNSPFKVGDEVYFSGELTRNGTNSEFTVVDERIVAKKPKSLSFTNAAAFPLVALTAYEGIFDQLGVSKDKSKNSKKSILIINGAGGVGSIAIQIAKYVGLTVISTASREDSTKWVTDLGSDIVLNHKNSLSEELKKKWKGGVDYVFNCHDFNNYISTAHELLNPGGKIVFITGPDGEKFDIGPYFAKRLTITFEFMFSKSLFGYDVESQGEILKWVADLIDKGVFKNIATKTLDFSDLKKAHELIEGGKTIGKIVLSLKK